MTWTDMVLPLHWDIQITAPTKRNVSFPARHEPGTATPPRNWNGHSPHKKGSLTLVHPDYETSRAGTWFARDWDDQTFIDEVNGKTIISVILVEPG